MLKVLLTVDVEVWCNGWSQLDANFAPWFRRYVYGPTPTGDFGLPYQLKVLADHGLRGVHFVEPLFATRFGLAPLQEIVGMIIEAGQHAELHLHTEWADEARPPILASALRKRPLLRQFDQEEQRLLVAKGRDLLMQAGAPRITAFRAGSFGFDRRTLGALRELGIRIDSSYNACQYGADSGVSPGQLLHDAVEVDGVTEVPLTVFDDGTSRLRPAQLSACSFSEMEGLLWQALESGRHCFNILSHNFELLNRMQDRADSVVIQRFRKLCRFLDRHRDSFQTVGFADGGIVARHSQPEPLRSPIYRTATRVAEQLYRRRYA